MICVSRPEKGAFKHLEYNQNPAPLAARQTTRQDLNDISNLREYVDSCQELGPNGDPCRAADQDRRLHAVAPPVPRGRYGKARLGSYGSISRLQTGIGGDGQDRLITIQSMHSMRPWSWIELILSILLIASVPFALVLLYQAITTPQASRFSLKAVASSRIRSSERSTTCASGGVSEEEYNLPLHVGAVFIVLFVSSAACAFPLIATMFPSLKIPMPFFFSARHFGTGVLLATAFCHLLPTAFISLSDPCLSGFWTDDYPAMPGAIVLGGIFLVTLIEMLFHPCRFIVPTQAIAGDGSDIQRTESQGRDTDLSDMSRGDEHPDGGDGGEEEQPLGASGDLEIKLNPAQQQRKDVLQCVLLEAGILFHSIFIGMSLSVSVGNDFIVLLVAIIFHQSFEGLALGARIITVESFKGKPQPWLMALAYGCTTPIGQAIGLGTHYLYNPNSEAGLLLVGIMNALSAGLLTFASLIELLAEDFLSDASWQSMRGSKRVYASLLVLFGAICMALVGAWA